MPPQTGTPLEQALLEILQTQRSTYLRMTHDALGSAAGHMDAEDLHGRLAPEVAAKWADGYFTDCPTLVSAYAVCVRKRARTDAKRLARVRERERSLQAPVAEDDGLTLADVLPLGVLDRSPADPTILGSLGLDEIREAGRRVWSAAQAETFDAYVAAAGDPHDAAARRGRSLNSTKVAMTEATRIVLAALWLDGRVGPGDLDARTSRWIEGTLALLDRWQRGELTARDFTDKTPTVLSKLAAYRC